MEPKLVRRPAFTVVGTKYKGTFEDCQIPAMWDTEFFPRVREIDNRVDDGIFHGLMYADSASPGGYAYAAGAEVSSADDIPDGMVSVSVPEQTYAVFPTTLPTLMEAFAQAEAWFAHSGRQRTVGPEFEYYDADFQNGQRMYLYVPVAGPDTE